MGGTKKNHGKQKEPKIVEDDVDDSEDEEIDEDEAFNSDDERKYGSFFAQKPGETTGSMSDDDDGEGKSGSDESDSEDEESEAGDGGQYMLDLLDRLDDKKEGSKEKKNTGGGQYVKESPFAASVLPAANLTLDSLMDGLQDTKGFGNVAKSLKKVATGKATSAPLDKVKSDRVERKLHYEKQSEEVAQWIDSVQENRKAETLDFRPKDRLETTRDVMIDTFVPSTDFEKQLEAALSEAGQKDEEAILAAEEKAITDDLGNNVITMEEYQKRQGQLAKMRALMLYHEQKRAHINKIKSKKYRRIRKRQREKAKEAEIADAVDENPDMARELEEKEEVDRMKERMTLAHKNTSKWAKRVLKRGKHADADTRRALSAQLKKGDDLLKRMKSRTTGEDDDDDDDSDEDLAESARKVLEDTEQDGDTPAKGLFKLAFMQRGVDKQRQRAKAEARQLLEELEEGESGSDSDGSTNKEDPPPKRIKVASAEEMKEVMKEGNLVAGPLTFGNSTSLTVSGTVSLDVGAPPSSGLESSLREHTAVLSTEHSTIGQGTLSESVDDNTATEKKTKAREEKKPVKEAAQQQDEGSKKKKRKSTTVDDNVDAGEENPWLAAAESSSGTTATKKKTGRATGLVDVERAADILGTIGRDIPNQEQDGPSTKVAEKGREEQPKKIAQLTQSELVQRAFAGINDQEDFAAEKQRVQDEEDGVLTTAKKKGPDPSTVSGWGSWAGVGAPPPLKRKLPKHLQAPKKKQSKRERKDDGKPKVILREGRIAKTANAYMLQQVPYPYKSREEYERTMMGGIGKEWNITVKEMTRQDVVTRPGKIIKPLSTQAKRKIARPAAKF